MTDVSRPDQLKRSISLPLLVSYGVGTMVGAGFYALLGRVAYHSGMHAPIALLLAACIALLTALAFCELSSRLPFSAGESRYVHEAFGKRWLSISIGWAVIATGIVSAATLTRAFVGFTQDLVPVPMSLSIILFVGGLTLVSVRGILESVWLATLITVIEVGGLVWVLAVNAPFYSQLPARWVEFVPGLAWAEWSGILIGGFLAFYAFIGFEDMVNEAEEVQDPRRNLPRGILWALILTTTLYLLIVVAAVLAFQPEQLAQARTPLALLVSRQGEFSRVAMTYISLFAGVNGALVQLIMASRVAYGMSDNGLGPRWLSVVNARYRTPVRATLLMSGLILAFALWLPLESLAKITSAIMLLNFATVNAALVKLKLTSPKPPGEVTCYPLWVPILGCGLCLLFLLLQLLASPA
jgi:APA family basic amino acid/polyamine antiporter